MIKYYLVQMSYVAYAAKDHEYAGSYLILDEINDHICQECGKMVDEPEDLEYGICRSCTEDNEDCEEYDDDCGDHDGYAYVKEIESNRIEITYEQYLEYDKILKSISDLEKLFE